MVRLVLAGAKGSSNDPCPVSRVWVLHQCACLKISGPKIDSASLDIRQYGRLQDRGHLQYESQVMGGIT